MKAHLLPQDRAVVSACRLFETGFDHPGLSAQKRPASDPAGTHDYDILGCSQPVDNYPYFGDNMGITFQWVRQWVSNGLSKPSNGLDGFEYCIRYLKSY